MSRAAQRKNNIIATGRQDGLRGYKRDTNPYYHGEARGLWYQGWEKGNVERRVIQRERKRDRRIGKDSYFGWFWRPWERFKDLFSGRIDSAAQTPARRRGRVW